MFTFYVIACLFLIGIAITTFFILGRDAPPRAFALKTYGPLFGIPLVGLLINVLIQQITTDLIPSGIVIAICGFALVGLLVHYNSPEQKQKRYLERFPDVKEEVESFRKWLTERCTAEKLTAPNHEPTCIGPVLEVVRQVYLTSFKEVYQFAEEGTYLKEAIERRQRNPKLAYDLYRKHLGEALMMYLRAFPHEPNTVNSPYNLYSAPALEAMDVRRVGVAMLHELYNQNNKEHQPMPRLWDTINTNVWRATRSTLSVDQQNRGERLWPNQFKGDAEKFLHTYFIDTPLLQLFYENVPVKVPDDLRLEHEFICAGSGTGKTQLMQAMIIRDMEKVFADKASIIVIDSQGMNREQRDVEKPTIIDNLVRQQSLVDANKLVYITPRPGLQLNFFDTGYNNPDLSPQQREIRRTAAVETVKSALGASTQLQHEMLSIVIEFAMRTGKPSIGMIYKILNSDAKTFPTEFGRYVKDAPQAMQEYFKTFHQGQRLPTKDALLTRVQALANNQLFISMADAERNDYQMIDLVEASKVIVIDADKARLGKHGAEAFGRYFIAQLLYASHQRQSSKPVYCFIDECHDFISDDDHIVSLLEQARKRNISMTLATQSLGSINSAAVKAALQNRSIIVTPADKTLHFNATVRTIGKLHVTVPGGSMEWRMQISPKTFERLYTHIEKPVVKEAPPEEEDEGGVVR